MSKENFGNLNGADGTDGNDIKVVSVTTNTAAGEANTLILGEFDSTTNMEVDPVVQTTVTVNSGVIGVTGENGTNGNDIRVVSATTNTAPGDSNTIVFGQFDTDTDMEVDPVVRTTVTVNPGAVGDTGSVGSALVQLFAESSVVTPAVNYPYHLILAGTDPFNTYTTTTTTDGRGLLKFFGGDTVSGDAVRDGGSATLADDAAPGGTIVISRRDTAGNIIIADGQEAAFITNDPTFSFMNAGETITVTLTSFVADGADYTVIDHGEILIGRATWTVTGTSTIADGDVTLAFSPESTATLPTPATYAAGSSTRYSDVFYQTYDGVTVTGVAGDYPDVNAAWAVR